LSLHTYGFADTRSHAPVSFVRTVATCFVPLVYVQRRATQFLRGPGFWFILRHSTFATYFTHLPGFVRSRVYVYFTRFSTNTLSRIHYTTLTAWLRSTLVRFWFTAPRDYGFSPLHTCRSAATFHSLRFYATPFSCRTHFHAAFTPGLRLFIRTCGFRFCLRSFTHRVSVYGLLRVVRSPFAVYAAVLHLVLRLLRVPSPVHFSQLRLRSVVRFPTFVPVPLLPRGSLRSFTPRVATTYHFISHHGWSCWSGSVYAPLQLRFYYFVILFISGSPRSFWFV